jgi:hypothetical protein
MSLFAATRGRNAKARQHNKTHEKVQRRVEDDPRLGAIEDNGRDKKRNAAEGKVSTIQAVPGFLDKLNLTAKRLVAYSLIVDDEDKETILRLYVDELSTYNPGDDLYVRLAPSSGACRLITRRTLLYSSWSNIPTHVKFSSSTRSAPEPARGSSIAPRVRPTCCVLMASAYLLCPSEGVSSSLAVPSSESRRARRPSKRLTRR